MSGTAWAMPSAVYIIGAADGDSEFIFTRGKTTKVEVNSSERITTDFARTTRLRLGAVPYVGLPEPSTDQAPPATIIPSYTPIPITFIGHDVRPRHPPPPPHLNPVLQETKSISDGLTHGKACILIMVKAANDLPQLTSWYDRHHTPSTALEPDPPSLQEPPPACRGNRNMVSRRLVEVLRRPSKPPASSKGKQLFHKAPRPTIQIPMACSDGKKGGKPTSLLSQVYEDLAFRPWDLSHPQGWFSFG
ncbi:hypothetical protein JB92DRAFT_2830689 [Gautieria morchelliformis]|nr:hypothetical protein JB92DRAFT_2830689 [Gautieria morchelliformis]